ncbi:MAG TPA: hypothetical protein VMP08_07195, partial [Anaerolineae bacterium]|nr:hypothetical protein [Anaerolineae bacterium]
MADVSALTCPNCGASLEPENDQQEIKCNYCGTVVMVPHAAAAPERPTTIVIPIEPVEPLGTGRPSRAVWLVPVIMAVAIMCFVGFIISSVMSQVSRVTDSALQPLADVLTAVPTFKAPRVTIAMPEATRVPRSTDQSQPTPAPTATTQVLPTMPSYAKVVLRDDFSNPKSGWDRTTTNGNSMNYTDNGYLISIGSPGDGESSWIKDGLKNVSVEVDEETQSGGGWYGVMCRAKEGVGGYSFEIDTDGNYEINKYIFNANGDTSKELASGTLSPD